MKKDIHPEKQLVEVTMNDGVKFHLMMALPENATELTLDVDPTTHPAWREDGGVHLTDSTGQVSKFKEKFAGIF